MSTDLMNLNVEKSSTSWVYFEYSTNKAL